MTAPKVGQPEPGIWLYRYENFSGGPWQLSVATHAPPQSGKLSLGGFRIVPTEVANEPGFSNDAQAVGLAKGMEDKIRWSRLVNVGGPLALRNMARLVGGKCVLCPSVDSRIGQPRDREMLDWAAACLHDLEARAGFQVVTGQDLGHGVMSDGTTQSLAHLNSRFRGSVVSDTSQPTGEGNYRVLKGILAACNRPMPGARIGLIGCGHIGSYVLDRALSEGAEVIAVEASLVRREAIAKRGIPVKPPEEKEALLEMALDAIVVNANKRSLDSETVSRILANPRVRVVCGSENEAMPDPTDADRLRGANKIYSPTEFGGMMGYLTAVEEYCHQVESSEFDIGTMIRAGAALEPVARRIAKRMIESDFALSFEAAADLR